MCPRVRSLLLLLLLVVPSASAGVPFVLSYEDPVGDNPAASADVVRFESSVRDGLVTQRVTMAAPPDPVQDTLILRSWFHNSTNGSFHVLDLEIHAHADGDAKFRAFVRRDAFENVTEVAATHTVDGDAWVFFFAEDLVADASCFDPIVWAQHEPENGSWSADQGGIGTRYCRVRGDPPIPSTPASSPIGIRAPRDPPTLIEVPPRATTSAPAGERIAPPGSAIPPISPWVFLGLVVVVGALTYRTWRRS